MPLRLSYDYRRLDDTTFLRIADKCLPATRRYMSEDFNLQQQRHRENVTSSLLTVRQTQRIIYEMSDRSQHQQKT